MSSLHLASRGIGAVNLAIITTVFVESTNGGKLPKGLREADTDNLHDIRSKLWRKITFNSVIPWSKEIHLLSGHVTGNVVAVVGIQRRTQS